MLRNFLISIGLLIAGTAESQNYAVNFDNFDDYIAIPSTLYGTSVTNFTIECWIKPNSGSFNNAYHSVVGFHLAGGATSDRNPGMWINNGVVHYDMYQTTTLTRYTGNTAAVVVQDKWNHLAMVKSGTSFKLYVNGKLEINTTVSSSVRLAGNYRIGYNDNFFSGLIDEVRFWSTARSQQEIIDYLYRSPANNSTGLVAYYKLNSGTGTTATNSCTNTSNINGTLTNGPTWSSSPSVAFSPNSIRLSGSTDYLQADIASAGGNTLTMECWVKFNSLTSQQNFLGMYQGLTSTSYCRIIPFKNSSHGMDLYIANTSGTATTITSGYTVSANTWYHVAYVYDNQKAYIYINGVLQASNTSTVAYSMDGTDVLSVGNDRTGGNVAFNSDVTVDELRIWNIARTATQIIENMDKYVPPTTTGMLAYYNFDQGSASGTNTDLNQFYNQCVNGNLIPTNVTLSSTSSNLIAQTSPVASHYIWNGNTSTAFNTATNWAEELVPAAGSHIELISSPLYNPILDQNRSLGDVILPSGTQLSLNNYSLTIDGKLTGTGTIKAGGTSSLSFIGDYASATLYLDQTTNKTTNSLQNLTVQLGYAGTLTLGNATYLTSLLDVTWGSLATGGNLTLRSTATATAMIANLTDGTITGNVVAERYIPGRRAFRLISSPINSVASIYTNWQEGGSSASGWGTHITGSTTGSNGFDATISGNSSLFTFNNSNSTWSAVTSTNNATNDLLVAGTPYRLMIRGDRTIDLTSASPTASNTTLRVTGTVYKGNKVFNGFSTTAGAFNLIGNPYQSAVDMGALLGSAQSNTNLNAVYYYVWDPTVGTRGAYVTVDVSTNSNNVSGSAANKYLQPWQACFVKTKSAGSASFTFVESAKNTSTTATWGMGAAIPMVNVNLYQKDSFANKAMALDGLQLRFADNYSSELDDYDAEKPWNQDENFSVIQNGIKLSIECRANPIAIDTIQLLLDQQRHKEYVMLFDPANVDQLDIALWDSYLQKSVALSKNLQTQYSFQVDPTIPASSAVDRFSLRVNTTGAAVSKINFQNSLKVVPNPAQNQIMVLGDKIQLGSTVKIYQTSGKCVLEQVITDSKSVITVSPLSAGIYFVEIQLTDGSIHRTQFVKS